MARFQFRRSLRFENLEARQLLSSGGPTDQEQYMLQLINEARTNPAAAAAQITGEQSDRRRSGHAQVLQRQFAAGRADDRHGHAAASAGLEPEPGERRPGAKPVRGRHPDPVTHRQRRVDDPAADPGSRLHQHHFQRREHLCVRFVGHGSDAGVLDRLGRSQRRPPHQYPAAGRVGSKRIRERGHRARANPRQQSFVRPDGHHAGFRQPGQYPGPGRWRRLQR